MQALHVALGTAVFSKQQRARNVLTNPRSKRTIVASSTAQEQNAQSTSTSRMPTRREALSVSTASLLAAVVAPALIHVPAAAAAGGGSVSTVFVAGATGQTGRRVVEQLRRKGINVRAGVRDVKKAQSLGLAVPGGSSTGSVTLVEFDVTAPLDNIVAAIGNADAVVCATGFTPTASNWGGLKPNSSIAVDKQGTINLIDASKSSGVGHFVLVSSLLTNGADCKQTDNANYKVLQAFGGVLASKREAEVYLQKSGLDFTVVRPGGLSNEPATGGIVAQGADTLFGTDGEVGREISRDLVAEVAIEALFQASADNKIVEIVGTPGAGAPKSSWFDVPIAPVSGCATTPV